MESDTESSGAGMQRKDACLSLSRKGFDLKCNHCAHDKFKEFDESYYSCRNCGELIAKEAEIIHIRPEPIKGIAHTPQAKTLTHEVCSRFKNSIIQQRKGGASWETITHLLKTASKAKLCAKTVQKHAMAIIEVDPYPVPLAKVVKPKREPNPVKPKKTFAEKCRVVTKQERMEAR